MTLGNLFSTLNSHVLSHNRLLGSIPNFTFPLLEVLGLNHNTLTGNIPNFNLGSLKNMSLNNNQLEGNIPNFNLPKLQRLSLGSNKLSGSLPLFNNLPSLEYLWILSNQLTNSFPNFDITSLKEIIANNNNFSDNIPAFNLMNLDIIDLSNNTFNGSVPIFDLPKLANFKISNNRIQLIPNMSYIVTWNSKIQRYGSTMFDVFKIEKNSLTFSSILNNISIVNNWISNAYYAPQDSIFKDTTYRNTEGSSLSINLGIDDTVTTNIYKWFKNGTLFRTVNGNNKLTFASLALADVGVYTCQVTNPNAPLLTLYSRKATVAVNIACIATIGNGANRRLLIDSILCYGGKSPFINFAFASGTQGTGGLTYKIDTFTQSLIPTFRDKIGAGKHRAILIDGVGCSDTLDFTIGQPNPINRNISASPCFGQTYRLPSGKNVSISGLYRDTLKSFLGCDSILITNLTFRTPTDALNDNITLKDTETATEFNVTDNDTYELGAQLSVTLLRKPQYGTLTTLGNGKFRYETSSILRGSNQTFTYQLCTAACPTVCDSARVTIDIQGLSPIVKDSKGITPNNRDGKNDVLVFDETEDLSRYPESELQIYNRWNDIVFRAKPYLNNWDGSNQGGQPLPAGTYYYILQLDKNAGKMLKGDVTIIR